MLKLLFFLLFRSLVHIQKVVKRAVLVFVVFFAVIFLFIYFIGQDRVSTKKVDMRDYNRIQIYSQIDTLEKENTTESKITVGMYRSWMCSMTGEACTDNPADGNENYNGSFLGKMTGLISLPYANPPASSLAWLNYSLQNTGFIPSAFAATGTGFASLEGYMKIWKLFRDISYLLLVLVMISIGFMIMFRLNVGGQSAVGIESALPRIVIAMIMITFSFPIAGFLIDMMYALIAICVGLLYNTGLEDNLDKHILFGIPSSKEYLNTYLTAGFTQLLPMGLGKYFSVGNSLWQLMPMTMQTTFQIVLVPAASFYAGAILKIPEKTAAAFNGISGAGFSLGNLTNLAYVAIFAAVAGSLLIWGPGIIFGLIIMLTVLLFMFRIFFMLLESYIKILLYTILAPIILMFSALPGNGSIGWWLKNLIGELITFPTVIAITLVGNAIIAVNTRDMDLPLAHLIPGTTVGHEFAFRLPFLYGFQADDFNTIIALGLILMIPDFVKMVKGFIGVQESPLKFGIGTFFAGASIFSGGLGLGANIQSWKQSAVGYDPNKGWMDSLPFMGKFAERIRGFGNK